MRVFAVLGRKGGTGKTSLCLHFAVAAGRKTVVFDLDDQRSAMTWAEVRDAPEPRVMDIDPSALHEAVDAAREDGYRFVFVDVAGRSGMAVATAAQVADLCVVPCGPSALDVAGIADTVEYLRDQGRATVLVVNQGRPGSPRNAEVQARLKAFDFPVCPTVIMRRAVLADAFLDGKAVQEVEPKGKGAAEIVAAWRWLTKKVKK
jgi:chromosome partitioning protein